MTPQDLLDHFGSQTAIADFFKTSPTAVCKWFKAGEVPEGRQYEAQVRTNGVLYIGMNKKKQATA